MDYYNFIFIVKYREIPIPDHIDIAMLCEEAEASDRTALQAVVDRSMAEIKRLEAEEIRVSWFITE